MLDALLNAIKYPFTYAYEIVDARPPGSVYRTVTVGLTAVQEKEGEIALVAGKGKIKDMPVIHTITAGTPVEAVNGTLAWIGGLRRSTAKPAIRAIRDIDCAHRQAIEGAKRNKKNGKAKVKGPRSISDDLPAEGAAAALLA